MITIFIIVLVFLGSAGDSTEFRANPPDPCTIYGSVFVESNPKRADFVVYLESREAFADVTVFREDNKLLADNSGLWYFTEQENFADFTIFIASEPSNVDFTIFYTDQVAYAGCK